MSLATLDSVLPRIEGDFAGVLMACAGEGGAMSKSLVCGRRPPQCQTGSLRHGGHGVRRVSGRLPERDPNIRSG